MNLEGDLLEIKRKQNISWNIAKIKVKENPSLDLFTMFYDCYEPDSELYQMMKKAKLSDLSHFPSRCTYMQQFIYV